MRNKKKTKHSMKNKIIISFMLIILVVMGVGAFFTVNIIKTNLRELLIQKSTERSREIAKQVEYILESNSNEKLQKFLESTIEKGDITYAIVINKDLKAIAHSDKNKIGKVYSDDKYTENGAKNGKEQSKRYYADVQKIWTYDIMVPIYKDGQLYGALDIAIPEQGVAKIINNMVWVQIIVTIITICVTVVGLYLLFHMIIKRVKKLYQLIYNTSQLDLQELNSVRELTEREDEIGEVSNAIVGMRDQLREVIKIIKNSSQNINMSSQNLSASSQEMSITSENVSSTIQDVAKGSENQAVDLVEVTKILNDFSSDLDRIVKDINEINIKNTEIKIMADGSNKDMEKVNCSVKNVNETFNELSNKIEEVTKNIEKINEITSFINGISEQTNLLALNAAIEAARAGEVGRGFSVVAEEIRKLAEQSKVSSQSITTIVNDITLDTEIMLKTTGIVENELEAQKESIYTTINSFGKIRSAVDEIDPKIEQTNGAIKELDSKKKDILEKVEGNSSISQEVLASSEEIAASSEQMSSSIEEIASAAVMLSNMTKDMLAQVNRFKMND